MVVSSRSGEFKGDVSPISRESEWEGKCAISTGRCSLLRGRATVPIAVGQTPPNPRDRYPHVRDWASGLGVDHTAAEFDRGRRSGGDPREGRWPCRPFAAARGDDHSDAKTGNDDTCESPAEHHVWERGRLARILRVPSP